MGRLSKRKTFVIIGTIVLTIAMFCLLTKYKDDKPSKVTLSFDVTSSVVDQYQVYYDVDGSKEWSENNSAKADYTTTDIKDKLKFIIPGETKNIRIDFGNSPKEVEVSNLTLKKNGKLELGFDDIKKLQSEKSEVDISYNEGSINVKSTGNDPYAVLGNLDNEMLSILEEDPIKTVFIVILSLISGLILANALLETKKCIKYIKVSISNRDLIKSLSINDFKSKYASSYLGIIWGFIHPLITICVYWFVFQVAFKNGPVGDIPFILWFISGIIPWFFFSEAMSSAANAFIEYSYLVKKVVFKIEILPTVKIISALFVHIFFVLFLFVVMIGYKRYPNLYTIQLIYYSIAMMVLVFSISVFTSAVILFFRDLGQVIGIIINVGFWATPIGWQLSMLPEKVARVFKLNPMYYIVTGYRDSFVNNIYVWERPYETIYFWLFCIILFCLGVKIHYKLKPHFSDVI